MDNAQGMHIGERSQQLLHNARDHLFGLELELL